MEKNCSLCRESKPLDLAHFPYIKRKNRWCSWCRDCIAKRTREYNAKHPDERRSRDQAYYDRTKAYRREYERKRGRAYSAREAVKESRRKHHQMLKRNCMAAYSVGREIACVCCNENILDFLTRDHERNDGKAHRDSLGGRRNGPRFYKWLEQQGYPQDLGLRVMCQNCNWARHWNNGICPHELARQELLDRGSVRVDLAA